VNEHAAHLIQQYKERGLLLDANLLLLFCLGTYDRDAVVRSRRMSFTERDFDLLVAFMAEFVHIATTPNILTEVSNLATNNLQRGYHAVYLPLFGGIIGQLDERYVKSAHVAALPVFNWLALTDGGIGEVARGRYLVLSIDVPLISYLEREGVAVLNFNHIRELAWRNQP